MVRLTFHGAAETVTGSKYLIEADGARVLIDCMRACGILDSVAILDRDPEGFFLMVENEGSDTEAHANVERDVLVAEMLDFDDAVRVALEYQERHPETLVVVTADHETGGLGLTPDRNRNVILRYSTRDHTAAFVPLFASGPGAERFGGLKENWEIG
ncbi:MAG: alkaline phosphatase, partial [Planctomycetes bacterium]|nr:alkaline phosphatase [Planctomycetota bacterium]